MASWKNKGKTYVKVGKRALKTDTKSVERREEMRTYTEANRDAIRVRAKLRLRERRERAIAAYGGKCECCKESRYEFLSLDHIDGGGNEHRRKFANSSAFFTWAAQNGYPKDVLRVLCYNCNAAVAYHTTCPHKNPNGVSKYEFAKCA